MPRQSTSMSLDADLLRQARALGINLSRAAESGVMDAIRQERARLWKQENAEAISDYNAFVEEQGIPLSNKRNF